MEIQLIQSKPLADVLQNRCFQKFRKVHRKTPMLDSLFTKEHHFSFFTEPLRATAATYSCGYYLTVNKYFGIF